MQTNLSPRIRQTAGADVVESILRKCVHCGFCNATCPTYQLLGDELDGPRGRIYQMKQYFEGEPANGEMLKHLDRCLSCRSCETTCPSGVNYSQLLEIGRHAIERELPRPAWQRASRQAIVALLGSPRLFALGLRLGWLAAPLLPPALRRSLPPRQVPVARRQSPQQRKLVLLAGCVQGALAPNTNHYTVNLLDRFGIEAIETPAGLCCGAAAQHTSAPERGLAQARRMIDACWPLIQQGAEAVVVNASGCGLQMRDYARLLADDPAYADKAALVSDRFRDLLEIVEAEIGETTEEIGKGRRVAVHTPCTLQHGLGINGRIEALLAQCGYIVCKVADPHLCCGSAGTYSLLQPELSQRLRANKLEALTGDTPEVIVTANVGCQLQLARDNPIPVRHWVELIQVI